MEPVVGGSMDVSQGIDAFYSMRGSLGQRLRRGGLSLQGAFCGLRSEGFAADASNANRNVLQHIVGSQSDLCGYHG
jgi:hypothetical protein